jgi:hypothetical protein
MIINEFGEVSYRGKASTWEDIQTSINGVQLEVPAGTADRNFDNNSITLQPGGSISTDGDCLAWSVQYPHKAKTNGELRVHMHWEQTALFAGEMTLAYRVQQNGGAKSTLWITDVVPFGSGPGAYANVTLTLAAQPTADDMMTLGSVTYTFVETASVSGDIEIGSELAETQANIVAAIRGTDGGINEENPDVDCATEFEEDDTLLIEAREIGAAGNLLDSTETFTSESNVFSSTTLLGGAEVAEDVFEYTSGTLNQITRLAAIPVAGLSTIVQFRLCRTDSETGDIEVLFLDAHYEIDGTGSSEEYVK